MVVCSIEVVEVVSVAVLFVSIDVVAVCVGVVIDSVVAVLAVDNKVVVPADAVVVVGAGVEVAKVRWVVCG